MKKADVLIIGAGAAGLASALALSTRRKHVAVLEARDRIGGRVYSIQHPTWNYPIELGAEFVHGKAPEILHLARSAHLVMMDVPQQHWYVRRGVLAGSNDLWPKMNRITGQMKKIGSRDVSFQQFLESYVSKQGEDEAITLLKLYIQGFHAARIDEISVRSINELNEADERIEGDQQFRILQGYGKIMDHLYEQAIHNEADIQLNTVVEELRWSRQHVEVVAHTNHERKAFHASRAIITLPLGVLQAGSVKFLPDLQEKFLSGVHAGQALKINLRFEKAFWEGLTAKKGSQTLYDFGFIHAPDEMIPTWWTQLPLRVPLLVGWAGGASAENLLQLNDDAILDRALHSLHHILNVPRKNLNELFEAFYMHNWQKDPWSRCAYSYVTVGGVEAQKRIAQPLEDTLFFAGEATNSEGHIGTVHGAIATGYRAAQQLMERRL